MNGGASDMTVDQVQSWNLRRSQRTDYSSYGLFNSDVDDTIDARYFDVLRGDSPYTVGGFLGLASSM